MTLPPSRWWPLYAVIAGLVLASHCPEWAGIVTCDPIRRSASMLAAPGAHPLPGVCALDANDGATLLAFGGRAAELWLRGTVPWWNSLAGLGLPLAAEAQPAAFFLPFVLLLQASGGILLLKLAMQFMAGAAGLALFRELGMGRAAALTGATLLALNGSFAWFAHSPILPIPFLPLLLFGLERCRTRAAARRPGGPAWVAAALAWSIAAGFPETAFLDGLLAALWAALCLLRTPPAHRLALTGKIAAGAAAGLALSAPAWLSFIDYLRIANAGIHLLAAMDTLSPSHAITLLLPSIFGPPFADVGTAGWTAQDGGYFGPAMATLALLALCTATPRSQVNPRRAITWAMAGWIAYWFSVFLGAPVTHFIWASLPPLNVVFVTRYALPSMICAGAILAACAVEQWRRSQSAFPARRAAALFLLLAAAGMVPCLLSGRLPPATPAGWAFLALSLLEAAAILWAIAAIMGAGPSHRRAILLAAAVSVDATLHFTVPEFAGARPGPALHEAADFLRQHTGYARVYALSDHLPTNAASRLGIAAIQADSVPFAARWNQAATAIGGRINMSVTGWLFTTPQAQLAALRAAIPNLQQAGLRYVITSATQDPFATNPPPSVTRAYADAATHIYELASPAPYMSTSGADCTLAILTRTHARATCAAPAILLRRELLLPGWHARINGAKTRLSPGSGPISQFFQCLPLPQGQSDIEFQYTPPHAALMAWLTAAGAFAVAGMVITEKNAAALLQKSSKKRLSFLARM